MIDNSNKKFPDQKGNSRQKNQDMDSPSSSKASKENKKDTKKQPGVKAVSGSETSKEQSTFFRKKENAGKEEKQSATTQDKSKKKRSFFSSLRRFVSLSNISIVNVVHIGFSILVLNICINTAITYSSLTDLQNAFNVVSEKATPLALNAKTLEADLLSAHNVLNQIITEKAQENIPELEQKLVQLKKEYQNNLELFKQAAQDDKVLLEIISGIETISNQYFDATRELPSLRVELLQRTATVAKQKASFSGLLRFFNDEESNYFNKIDDDFLKDSFRCMKAAQSTIEANTTQALDTEIPEKIQKAIDSNRDFIKEFNTNLNDLKRELKDLDNNLGTYINTFVYDTTNPKGLLSQHQILVDEIIKTQEVADNAKVLIEKVRTTIKQVQALSDSIIQTSNSIAATIFDKSNLIQMFAVVIAILIAVFIAFLVGRSIRIPLSRILSTISAMSDGDYTQNLEYNARNEFGKLTCQLNKLRIQFADVLRQMAEASNKVKQAAEINKVSSANTASGIQTQQKMTEAMVTSMDEMRASGAEVANAANRTHDIVLQAGDAVTNGRDVINRTIDSTKILADKIQSTGDIVNQVSTMSNNISTVIQVIRSVADQTNLLALNAAIEAARAGEHGRGFAVVADEVRSLANKTAESTNEIRKVIEGLQSSVSLAVSSMEECRSEMEISIKQTTDVNEAIQQIQSSLNTISEYSDHIVNAAAEQEQNTSEVALNIHTIASISETNVKEIDKVNHACIDLNNLANSQADAVQKFKF